MPKFRMPTPLELEDLIFGSGLSIYEWWGEMYSVEGNGSYSWTWRVQFLDPETDGREFTSALVTYQDVMRTVEAVVSNDIECGIASGREFQGKAAMALFVPDLADWDASDADSFLQLTVMGRVVYG